jgi:Flp pilus assembly protein TadD
MARADTLEEKGRPNDALRPARLAVELFPQSHWAHSHLGDVYKALGRTEEAARAFRKVKMLNPAREEEIQEELQLLKQTGENKTQ